MQSGTCWRFQSARGATGHVYGHTPTNATPVGEITARRCAHRAVLTQTGQSRSSNSSTPFFLQKGRLSKGQLEPWTGTIDLPQSRSGGRQGSHPQEGVAQPTPLNLVTPSLCEGGKNRSGLDTTLVDEAWWQVRPHQRTLVKFAGTAVGSI